MASAFSPTSLRKFKAALEVFAQHLGRDASLRQLQTYLVIAEAGSDGIDTGAVAEATKSSSAATSRNVRVIGTHHHDRTKGEGLGLAELQLDPYDNRRRIARLTELGQTVCAKALSNL